PALSGARLPLARRLPGRPRKPVRGRAGPVPPGGLPARTPLSAPNRLGARHVHRDTIQPRSGMPGGHDLNELLARPSTRRGFLVGTGVAACLIAAREADVAGLARRLRASPEDPFTLGVASGDPTPGGIVLWTRLAPDPLHGGLGNAPPVAVDWEVARDEQMRDVVRRGTAGPPGGAPPTAPPPRAGPPPRPPPPVPVTPP